MREQSKKQRLVSELWAIQKVQEEKPSWFRAHDYERLRQTWFKKSAELVALEVSAYRKKLKL